MKSLLFFSATLFFLMLVSCSSSKNTTPTINKIPDQSTGEGKFIISAEIVQIEFENKIGKISERKEYYVRRSIQDYFIKFCESGLTEQEFEKLLNAKGGPGSSFKMEIEVKDGFLDSCNSDQMVQSRTGSYIVIHKVIE